MADGLDEQKKQIQRAKVNPVMPAMGLAVGVVPFFVSFRTSHESTSDLTASGIEIRSVTRRNPFDYMAVPCGAFAFVLGFAGLVRGISARKYVVLGVGVAAMIVGVIQLVRGILP
jgi:hypothetical protein